MSEQLNAWMTTLFFLKAADGPSCVVERMVSISKGNWITMKPFISKRPDKFSDQIGLSRYPLPEETEDFPEEELLQMFSQAIPMVGQLPNRPYFELLQDWRSRGGADVAWSGRGWPVDKKVIKYFSLPSAKNQIF